MIENGGIFVCKTRHLSQAGGGKVRDGLDWLFGYFLYIFVYISLFLSINMTLKLLYELE